MARMLMGPLERAVVVENPDPGLDELLGSYGIEAHRLTTVPDEAELIHVLQETRAHGQGYAELRLSTY